MAKKARKHETGEFSMSNVIPAERDKLREIKFWIIEGVVSVTLLRRDVGECIDRLKQYFGLVNFKIAE